MFLVFFPGSLNTEWIWLIFANFTYFSNNILRKKKSMKLVSLSCKDKSSKNLSKLLVSVKVSSFLISYLTHFQRHLMTYFHKKRVTFDCGSLRLQTCFVTGENLRNQALLKILSATHLWNRKQNLQNRKSKLNIKIW